MISLKDFKAVVIGAAIGDALGVPVEFSSREELKNKPLTDMMGYGTYNMPPGTWSDDTSMCLATLDAFTIGDVCFEKIMDNFIKWYKLNKFTPTNYTFDIGGTTSLALEKYIKDKYVFSGLSDEHSNGNGSLMRIYPFVLFANIKGYSFLDTTNLIIKGSKLTHAHEASIVGCLIYYFILEHLINEKSKDAIKLGLKKAKSYLKDYKELSRYYRLFSSDFINLKEEDIKSSGYIVDTLEASIWCVLNSNSYEECVLKAVNLGLDTDTTGTIAGSLAGILYGYDTINKNWKEKLIKREYIEKLCDDVYKVTSYEELCGGIKK